MSSSSCSRSVEGTRPAARAAATPASAPSLTASSRAADAGDLSGGEHSRDGCRLLLVDGDGERPVGCGAHLAAGEQRELRLGGESVADGKDVHRDASLRAASDRTTAVEPGDGDGLEAVTAVGGNDDGTVAHRDVMADQAAGVRGRLRRFASI